VRTYQVVVTFTTRRPLGSRQRETLLGDVEAQIESVADGTIAGASAAVTRATIADVTEPPELVRHTACRHCGADIEGFAPFKTAEWRDRGNNTTCDGTRKHQPTKE
jgi:hypothetical protein